MATFVPPPFVSSAHAAAPPGLHQPMQRMGTPRLHRSGAPDNAMEQFNWEKPAGADLGDLWKRVTDPNSWLSHGAAALVAIVIALIAFVLTRPSFMMIKTEDGLTTDKMHIPRMFIMATGIGIAVLVGSLSFNGMPGARH
jgi:hypothetical protein